MTISAPTELSQRLKAHLDEADRGYFDRHPEARWRKRLYIPGEADLEPTATTTIVTRCTGGRLRRTFHREDAA